MQRPDIKRLKDSLSCRKEVVAAYLFGSCVSERSTQFSDIDIGLLIDSSVNRGDYGTIKLDVINGLIEEFSFDRFDVVILNAAPPLLSHEILKKGLLLFSGDEKQRIEFAARETARYLDTIHLRKIQDRVLHEKIRRKDFGYFKGSRKYSIEKIRKGASDTPAVK
jgi:predicted nucleotidyltransferase